MLWKVEYIFDFFFFICLFCCCSAQRDIGVHVCFFPPTPQTADRWLNCSASKCLVGVEGWQCDKNRVFVFV